MKGNGQVNLFCYIYNCPIGTKLRLKEDPSEHEVSGYEWFNKGGNIIFKDGSKLDMTRFEQLVETLL